MAHAVNTNLPIFAATRAWVVGIIAQEVDNLRNGLARRDVYRRTYCALQSQSNAELAAQGLSRRDVAAMAHDRAMAV